MKNIFKKKEEVKQMTTGEKAKKYVEDHKVEVTGLAVSGFALITSGINTVITIKTKHSVKKLDKKVEKYDRYTKNSFDEVCEAVDKLTVGLDGVHELYKDIEKTVSEKLGNKTESEKPEDKPEETEEPVSEGDSSEK